MRILWHNVFCFFLFIFAIVILTVGLPSLKSALSGIGEIGRYHSSDEKTLGLICLGLLCVTFVAIVKILTRDRK